MLTFLELLEKMTEDQEPSGFLMSSGEDTHAMRVIRTGLHLRNNKKAPNFWDDFLQVMGDPQGVSDLLGIKPQQVRTWQVRIKELIRHVEEADAQNPEGKENKQVIPTGNNGAIVTQ